MSLANLVQKSANIRVGDKESFTVHPLTIGDLSSLLSEYQSQVESLFTGKVDIAMLIKEAPDFVSAMIALSTREKGDKLVEQAKGLPLSTQVIALTEIWGLTIYDPKEFMVVVKHLLSLMGAEELPEPENPASKKALPTGKTS